MGQAIALAYAREGAIVHGCDLSEEGNAKTVELLGAEGLTMHASAPVDLSDPEQCQAWIDEAASMRGHVDVLYNNASGPAFATMPEMTIEQWQFGVRNEIDLVFYAAKFAWPWLKGYCQTKSA